MNGKNIAGLIYSNSYDNNLPELTNLRTMGSVPFGGRYRLIDFMLSNMVNTGISKVGVLTKNNYRSLMDHIGMGRPWDLARKREGIYLLPPFNSNAAGDYSNRLEACLAAEEFIRLSKEEYILMSDSNIVCSFDLGDMSQFHTQHDADITIGCMSGKTPNLPQLPVFETAEDGRITDMELAPKDHEERFISAHIVFMKKNLLLSLMREARSHGYTDFDRDIIQRNINRLKIYAYSVPGFCRMIDSLQGYYDINMELLDYDNRTALFCDDRPVFTKVRDDMPSIYGIGGEAKNSLIADGCVINGTVENSVLSRGVYVEKGAVVKNCVLMQGTFIGEDASVNCVISDKNVVLKPRQSLSGAKNYPLYIAKGTVI